MTRVSATYTVSHEESDVFEIDAAPDDIDWSHVYDAIRKVEPFDAIGDDIEWEVLDGDDD